MAFPQTKLPITVELQINSVWTDISTDVRAQGGTDAITITRGIKASGGSVADPGTCTMTLDNNSGNYSSRNPSGPYYGYLGRNTPLRVGVAYGTPWLDCPHGVPNTASTPDAAVLDIVGDLDVRVDAELAVWGESLDVTQGTTELIGKYNVTGNQRSWRLTVNLAGQLELVWSTDGTAQTVAQSDPVDTAPGSRLSVRATLDVNNGAGGYTVVFYTSTTTGTAGPWTQLGSAQVTTGGITSIFSSTATLNVGDIPNLAFGNPARKIYGAEVRSGIAGTIVANPNFEIQTVGATSFADTAPSARTWTITAGALTNKYLRFVGEVSEWPPQWDTGGKDVTTPITASGVLQRYLQSRTNIQSTLRRSIPSDTSLLAYWPMEDGTTATQAASPLPGVSAMQTSGFTWASDSTLSSSGALPQLAPPSAMTARVPAGALGDWTVDCVYKLDTLPAAPTLILQVNLSSGTATTVQFLVGVGVARIQALDSAGAVLGTFDATPTSFTDGWGHLYINTTTAAGTVNVHANWVIAGTSAIWNSPTSYSGTPGRVASVTGTWGSGFASLRLGHLAVFASSATSVFDRAITAFDGETAATRVARVATEQSVPMSVAAYDTDTERVGAQPQDTLLNVITAAAQVAEGVLYEAREFLGLRFRGLNTMCTQPSALDIPYTTTGPQALMAPLRPVDDLQGIVNDSTVTRTNGSSGRVEITSGALSTNAPPLGIGTGYDENVTLNLHTDGRTDTHASWRTHLGTWDEARFEAINVSLEKNPALIATVCRVDTGSRIRITRPMPKWLPPDNIDQLALGYTEIIAQFSWRFAFSGRPYGPFRVGVVGASRVGGEFSTIAGSMTTTSTSVSVVTATNHARWTDSATYPSDFPFDIVIGGERMTVTAIAGTTNTQTFTVTRSVNGIVKTHAINDPISLFTVSFVGL